jgi:transforming growth factor-beta-induced protein
MRAWTFMMISFALAACDPTMEGDSDAGDVESDGGEPLNESIADIARADTREFSMLVAALERAELIDTLDGAGDFTVFAPTNHAFETSGITLAMIQSMPVEDLSLVLRYHVIGEYVPSSHIEAGPVTSLAGASIIFGTEGGVTLNGGNEINGGADVVTADVRADNGVIHVIDRMLIPPTVAGIARYAGLTTLTTAIETSNLHDDLAADGPFTLFAPTNDAFARLEERLPEGDALADILLYHVIAADVPSSAVPAMAASLAENPYENNLSLLFDTSTGVRINGVASVVTADLHAINGVVHVIDRVLLPMNLVGAATAAGFTQLLGAVTAAAPINETTTVLGALSTQAPYTVFAPTNAAFEAIAGITSTLTPAQLRQVLLFHVLDTATFPIPVLAAHLPENSAQLDTLIAQNIAFDPSSDPPMVEGAHIVSTDIVVTNGVIHVIDAVMVPDSLD